MTGGGGSRKSDFIKAIYHTVVKTYRPAPTDCAVKPCFANGKNVYFVCAHSFFSKYVVFVVLQGTDVLQTFLEYVECFRRFALRISCQTRSPCFHSFSVVSCREFDEKKQLDHESLIDSIFHTCFIKAIDHSSCGFTSAINYLRCWDNTQKACKSLA